MRSFYFKKFGSEVSFFQKSCCHRWPGTAFCLSNWQITDSDFLLFLVLYFVHGFHMCCAQCFACSFVFLFDFWLYVCNSSLALFFTTVLRLASFIFLDKLFIFAPFAFCRFFPVVPPRFACLHVLGIYCFFVPCFVSLFLGVRLLISWCLCFLSPFFCAHFALPDFSCFTTVSHRFAIVFFPFFYHAVLIFSCYNTVNMYALPNLPRSPPKSRLENSPPPL